MNWMKTIAIAAVVSAVAAPAMASSVRPEFRTGYHGRQAARHMRAQDYDHFDYGIARPRYRSGWGGPYGDGEYPGTIGQNMGPTYW